MRLIGIEKLLICAAARLRSGAAMVHIDRGCAGAKQAAAEWADPSEPSENGPDSHVLRAKMFHVEHLPNTNSDRGRNQRPFIAPTACS
jgi:hypothetical protein